MRTCRGLGGGTSGGVSSGQMMKGLESQAREFTLWSGSFTSAESAFKPLSPSFYSRNEDTETEFSE